MIGCLDLVAVEHIIFHRIIPLDCFSGIGHPLAQAEAEVRLALDVGGNLNKVNQIQQMIEEYSVVAIASIPLNVLDLLGIEAQVDLVSGGFLFAVQERALVLYREEEVGEDAQVVEIVDPPAGTGMMALMIVEVCLQITEEIGMQILIEAEA